MTEEDRKLLLKDLSARLQYGIICEDGYGNTLELNGIDNPNTATFKCFDKTFWTTDLDKCKPYLFPLSSMTEEQLYELREMFGFEIEFRDGLIEVSTFHHSLGYLEIDAMFEWFNKNHFDYRGLIPAGVAIDATGLNMY